MSDLSCEGFMFKWTNCCSGWQKRYFILKDNVLHYCLEKGARVKGKIHINVCDIIVDPKDDKKFTINTGITNLFLRTNESEDRKKWIDLLTLIKKRGQIVGAGQSVSKSKLNDANQAQNTQINSQDIKLLKRLYNAKDVASSLINSNKSLIKLLSDETSTSLKDFSGNYRVSLEKADTTFGEIIKGFDCFAEDVQKFRSYFDGGYDPNRHIDKLPDKKATSRNVPQNIALKQKNAIEYNNDDKFGTIDTCTGLVADHKCESNGQRFYIRNNRSNEQESKFDSDMPSNDSSMYEDVGTFMEKSVAYNKQATAKSIVHPHDISPPKIFKEAPQINGSFHLSTNYEHFNENYSRKRTKLPLERKKVAFKVWEILKDAVGKDLNRFSMPVYLNEPLSMIQRFAEVFQYAGLLNRAAKDTNPHMRLALVAGFCVAGFNSHTMRTTKFFNPILGETYELIDNELGFRYFGEQVSHHPAISAIHVEGQDYTLYANTNAKSKFDITGGSLNFEPIGRTFVNFANYDELISYTKPDAIVRNVVFGTMNIDTAGKSVLINHNTGDTIELTFFPKGKPNSDDQGVIVGELKDIHDNVHMHFSGNWKSHLNVKYKNGSGAEVTDLVWKSNLRQESQEEMEKKYFFSDYAINLNNDDEELLKSLPRTDSRLRPDQRALERQDVDLASKEKHRLEEKQRERRKYNEKNKIIYKPLYFTETYDDLTGELVYIYSRNYWEDKKKNNLGHFPDIYS